MKRLLIWFHRRRAARHNATSLAHPYFTATDNKPWHESWRDWHLDQIKRLKSK